MHFDKKSRNNTSERDGTSFERGRQFAFRSFRFFFKVYSSTPLLSIPNFSNFFVLSNIDIGGGPITSVIAHNWSASVRPVIRESPNLSSGRMHAKLHISIGLAINQN
jgi:hypothetical protein